MYVCISPAGPFHPPPWEKKKKKRLKKKKNSGRRELGSVYMSSSSSSLCMFVLFIYFLASFLPCMPRLAQQGREEPLCCISSIAWLGPLD